MCVMFWLLIRCHWHDAGEVLHSTASLKPGSRPWNSVSATTLWCYTSPMKHWDAMWMNSCLLRYPWSEVCGLAWRNQSLTAAPPGCGKGDYRFNISAGETQHPVNYHCGKILYENSVKLVWRPLLRAPTFYLSAYLSLILTRTLHFTVK